MTQKYFTGVISDPRPKKEIKKDWKAEEILAGGEVVEWKEKKNWKSYTERNQKGTSSCVPQSIAKLLEINEKNETGKDIVLSATKPYADRTNGSAGSWLQQMLEYACKDKYTTEKLLKSQNLDSDYEMEKIARTWNKDMENVAGVYAGKSYLTVNTDIDSIAYWVNQGFGVSILIYGDYDEWRLKYPKIKRKVDIYKAPIRHAIAVVDFGLKNGQKFLKIEDSAHFGGISERWLSQEFIETRCYGAGFVYDKPNIPLESPKWLFKRILTYGMINDTDVAKMQDLLKIEGFFPQHIPSTGNYLEITRQAVEKYQRFHKVAGEWELNWVKGKIVGPKTVKQLNS